MAKLVVFAGWLLLATAWLSGCGTLVLEDEKPSEPTKPVVDKPLSLGKKYKGRSAGYASAAVYSDKGGKYCLQDVKNKCISAPLDYDKVCFLQMQGSGMVDKTMYSWGGRNAVSKHSCAKWGSTYARSNVTRFKVDSVSHSIGSFNNVLVPFRSVACPRQFADRTRIYVPKAKGTKLPDGSIHDGIFSCDDRGGAIVRKSDGTYKIDTFLGLIRFHPWKMNDWGLTGRKSPFKHTANQNITHDFYVVE